MVAVPRFTPAAGGASSPPRLRSRTGSISSATRSPAATGARPSGDCNFTTDTESAYETYGGNAAPQHHADAHLVAYSGRASSRLRRRTRTTHARALASHARPATRPLGFRELDGDAVSSTSAPTTLGTLAAGISCPPTWRCSARCEQHHPQATLFAVTWGTGRRQGAGRGSGGAERRRLHRESSPSTSSNRRASGATTPQRRHPRAASRAELTAVLQSKLCLVAPALQRTDQKRPRRHGDV